MCLPFACSSTLSIRLNQPVTVSGGITLGSNACLYLQCVAGFPLWWTGSSNVPPGPGRQKVEKHQLCNYTFTTHLWKCECNRGPDVLRIWGSQTNGEALEEHALNSVKGSKRGRTRWPEEAAFFLCLPEENQAPATISYGRTRGLAYAVGLLVPGLLTDMCRYRRASKQSPRGAPTKRT